MSKKNKNKKDNSIDSTKISESIIDNSSTDTDVIADDALINQVSNDEIEKIEEEIVSSSDTNANDTIESINKDKSNSLNVVENTAKENKKAKNKRKKKRSKSSIFLYIVSILFLGYMCFNIYDSYKYIQELISYGSIDASAQAKEIVSYYVGTCSPYAFYSLVTWALGLILSKITEIKNIVKIENK